MLLEVGLPCWAAGVFFNVSVSAAKLSAVVRETEFLAGESDELDMLLATESEDGDRERLKRIGLGDGIGGLLANSPVGRSITRSGA